ncbi:MAG: sigma-70 family RNA polymerase sigma factor, partial [Actinobacteria bacterium]|nr:sigma-70 family RNA polymerase sigma factor [Actinomycetota bacterium]
HEGRACARVYRAASLDALAEEGFDETFQTAEDDVALELVEVRHVVLPLLRRLPERERRILVLRYVHCWSQSAIAEHIGVSQMHVSRLLARSLDRMREWLAA